VPEDELEKQRFLQKVRSLELSQRAVPDISLIDEEKRMIPFILVSKNNACERYDWWEDEIYIEELEVKGAKYDELRTFFKDHRPSVDNALGRVDNIIVDNGELKADVYFGSDEDAKKIFTKYQEGILADVSIGYRIDDFVETVKKDEPNHILVTSYRIHELSAVWKGADSGATVGRQKEKIEKTEAVEIPIGLREKKLNLQRKRV
jgi:hypothetical protein